MCYALRGTGWFNRLAAERLSLALFQETATVPCKHSSISPHDEDKRQAKQAQINAAYQTYIGLTFMCNGRKQPVNA
jgi:hypothetical protein